MMKAEKATDYRAYFKLSVQSSTPKWPWQNEFVDVSLSLTQRYLCLKLRWLVPGKSRLSQAIFKLGLSKCITQGM
jgi:hypothetical protein